MNSHLLAAARIPALRTGARRLSLLALLCAALPAGAVDFYWDANGTGNNTGRTGIWDTTSGFWRNGGTTGALGSWGTGLHTGDRAVFGGRTGTVTLAAGTTLNVNGLWFQVNGFILNSGTGLSRLNFTGIDPTITTDTGTTTIGAVLTGTNGMIKAGAGSLLLNGAATYTGTTRIDAGTLQLGGSERLANASLLTINGGTLAMGANSETVAAVTLTNGHITGSGTLTGSAFTVSAGDISAILAGTTTAVGLIKDTGGSVTLSGNSTYTGRTAVNYGTLVASGTLATAGVDVASGGTFTLGASNRLAGTSSINVTGGAFNLGAYSDAVGAVTMTSGSILGTGTLTGTSYALDSGTVSAVLAGANVGLVKDGSGTLTLSAVNTYTGVTTVRAGTLRVGGATDLDVINRDSAVTVEAGTLDLGNFTEDIGLFTLVSGTVTGGANAALGVNTTAALSGRAFDVRSGTVDVVLRPPLYPVGTDSTTIGLTKSTAGIVTLGRVNTYTGATTINGGTLQLSSTGSITTSAVAVNNTGILAGLGTSGAATGAVTVASGGRLSPGLTNVSTGISGIGTLNTGAETWNGGGAYAFQLNSVPSAGTAGVNWDRLAVNGALTIGATTSSPFTIQLMSLNAAGNAGVLQGFSNTQSYSWSLLGASSINGFAANKFTVDSTAFAAFNPLGGGSFSVEQPSLTSLNLVFTPVPEPRDYAMILGAITLGLVGYRRWRRPAQFA